MLFFDWKGRPAVHLVEGAYAVLRPGAEWTRADSKDVAKTGTLLTEAPWRDRFVSYGTLDLSGIPPRSPSRWRAALALLGFKRAAPAVAPKAPAEEEPMTFIDWGRTPPYWGGKPAVLLKHDAYAVLRPGGPWTRVDRDAVAHTGAVLTEADWRKKFAYHKLDLSKIPPPMTFIYWDGRPAVLLDNDAYAVAYAVLAPGAEWTRVDRDDVAHTGAVLTEAAWRRDLAHYGALDLSKIPSPMTFIDWDGQPAVLHKNDAYAVLAPGEGWTRVERKIAEYGDVLTEAAWRKTFARFRPFDLSMFPADPPMTFIDWDLRPAILCGQDAYAKLSPSDHWTRVDWDDVAETGDVLSEAEWRKRFGWGLHVSRIPHPIPSFQRAGLPNPGGAVLRFINWKRKPAVLREGSGREGSGRAGSGRAGSGRAGSGRAGPGREGSGRAGSGDDGDAYAVLRPGASWTRVDRKDVAKTGYVMMQDHWRQEFHQFGRLDVSMILDASASAYAAERPGEDAGLRDSAVAPASPAPGGPVTFVDWGGIPAVLRKQDAYAVLESGAPWTRVERDEVTHTGGILTELGWRQCFEPWYGPLGVSNIPHPSAGSPLPAKRPGAGLPDPAKFIDWEDRPAVLFKNDAYAVLAPGEGWTRVSWWDVDETGRVMAERAWRGYFSRFGRLDLSKIRRPSASRAGLAKQRVPK